MDPEIVEIVSQAMTTVNMKHCEEFGREAPMYFLAIVAIEEYEKAKAEAEDAEDERLYTEFHK